MESSITVDANAAEDFIYNFLFKKCPDIVKRERLDVGDVRIVTEHCTVIVERKHTPDLVSSIRDGRYKARFILPGDASNSSVIVSNANRRNKRAGSLLQLRRILLARHL